MRKLLVTAMVLALPLLADDRSKQELSGTHTDLFKVAAAGTIRLENSFGEVDVDGWDRPEIEVTVIRSSERLPDAKAPSRDQIQRRLDSVQVNAKQDGNNVVIATTYPPRNGFTHPFSRRSDIEISYRIKAPRASKLIIDHNSGAVSVFDMSGDIHATVINGQIALTLAKSGQYAIDAQCGMGSVYSDFDGHERNRRLVGEVFDHPGTAPAANLYLRARLGDIIIQELHGPPAD